MTKRPRNTDIRRHYEHTFASVSPEWRRLGAIDKARNVLSLCGSYDFANVVEIGAGDGAILEQLSRHGFAHSYTALEISKSAVDAIRDRNIGGLKEAVLFDGYSIPFEDGAFDLAILSHVIEHVEHPRLLLQEVTRIVRANKGAVFVEVPTELTLRAGRNFRWTDTGHINIYSPLTIRHLLQSTHFNVVSERLTNPSYAVHRFTHGSLHGGLRFFVRSFALRAMPVLANRVFTYHWSALCRPA